MLNVILQGNVIDELAKLAPKSVDCVMTSPPYWAQRAYGIADQIWGGRVKCSHQWGASLPAGRRNRPIGQSSQLSNPARHAAVERPTDAGAFCQICKAWRGSLGLEPSPELYVKHIVLVMRALYRVLADHGTLWLNLGDSYFGSMSATYGKEEHRNADRSSKAHGWKESSGIMGAIQPRSHPYLKPKDLCMIPAQVAIALQKDGWYLRNDDIWHKRANMPEGAKDRCVRNHEFVFQLTKKPDYYFDDVAIAEPVVSTGGGGRRRSTTPNQIPGGRNRFQRNMPSTGRTTRAKRTVWSLTSEPGGHRRCRDCKAIYSLQEARSLPERAEVKVCRCGSQSWTIHSAAFPPSLVRPCIQASTSEYGHCAKCGKPHVRLTEEVPLGGQQVQLDGAPKSVDVEQAKEVRTVGWQASCKCNAGIRPGIVLDPFMGSGTTALVAREQSRAWLGVDLNEDYIAIALERLDPKSKHLSLDDVAEPVAA